MESSITCRQLLLNVEYFWRLYGQFQSVSVLKVIINYYCACSMFETRPFICFKWLFDDYYLLKSWIYELHVLPILNAGECSRSYLNKTHKRAVVINACAREKKSKRRALRKRADGKYVLWRCWQIHLYRV